MLCGPGTDASKVLFFPYSLAKIHSQFPAGPTNRLQDMDAIIYGLVGHAGSISMPLEDLDLDDLATGREFAYQGRIYEIRSITEGDSTVQMNVVMIMEDV